MDLSVVIPLYNEAPSIQELFQTLKNFLDLSGKSYEIIFVDDGSTDSSFSILKAIHAAHSQVMVIKLRRNFGKTSALSAGFAEVQGEVIITMDSDLQDSPGEIPLLLRSLEEGRDLVSGWKFERKDGLIKRISSKIFNGVVSFASGIHIHDFNCGLKAFRREVIQEMGLYGEMHRFIPVLAGWRGFRIGEVKVKHYPRRYGESKFGPDRFIKGLFDFMTVMMLIKFIKKPLHLFGSLGLLIGAIGLMIDLYLTMGWFYGKWIGQRPLLILGVMLMIIGIQTIFYGLLAEMTNFLSNKPEGPSIAEMLRKKG
jgi:glycosyltransferase involved in cell wall biosynthesis